MSNSPSNFSQLAGLVVFGTLSCAMHYGFRWIHAQAAKVERAWEEGHPTFHQRAIRSAGRFLEWMGNKP